MMIRTMFFLVAVGFAAGLPAGIAWDALPERLGSSPAALALRGQGAAAQARQMLPERSFAPRIQAFGQGRLEAAETGSAQGWPEAGLRAQANLWKGGRDQAQSRWLGAESRASMALSKAGEAELLLQARRAWLQAWQARQRVQALQAAKGRCEEDQARIQRQVRAGLVPLSDALALEVLAAELDQHVFEEGHLADEAEHHLAALLGLEAAQAEGLAQGQTLDWPQARDAVTAKSWRQLILIAEAEALAKRRESHGGVWQPSFDLESQFRAGRAGLGVAEARDLQALAALSLAWDPAGNADREQAWLGGLLQAKELALNAQRRAEEVEVEELGHALRSWVERRAAIEARQQSTAAFRKAVLEENGRGVRDGRDLLDSNEAQMEADMDAVVAKVTAWNVWSELQVFEAGP